MTTITVSPRTIEFLIDDVIPQEWIETLTKVWNHGRWLLLWEQHRRRMDKCKELGIEINPYNEIKCRKNAEGKWEYYQPTHVDKRLDPKKSWDAANVYQCPINTIPYKFHSVAPAWAEKEPEITNSTAFELMKAFAKKRRPYLAESSLPSVISNDFIELVVAASWEAYQKGTRGKPRRKNVEKGEFIDTIPCKNFRSSCKVDGDRLRLPGIGWIDVPELQKRAIQPIAKMVEAMRENPDDFPELEAKQEKMLIAERSKLIKADGHSLKDLRKSLSAEEFQNLIDKYTSKVNRSEHLEKAIEYFSSPGAFRLCRKRGKTFLQISGFYPTKTTERTSEILVKTGLDLMVSASNGLVVKHQDFSKDEYRLSNMDRAISRCKYKSYVWEKLMAKKRKLEARIKDSKKLRQSYFASRISRTNNKIVLERITIKDRIGLPKPIPDGKGGYLPNGAGEAHAKNKLIHDVAIGQFMLLCKQQAKRRGRVYSEISSELEAPVTAGSEDNSPSSSSSEMVGSNTDTSGKSSNTRLLAISPKGYPQPIKPTKIEKKRNRKREKAIG